ncbi:MAG: diguanylate cyclase [Gammaproteobacteria bacterium]|nr:diguanylate cyclase [Gammaproteobacteria bacterium]
MRVKTQFYLLASITTSSILALSVSMVIAFISVDRALDQNAYANSILKSVSALTHELRYLIKYPNAQTKNRWRKEQKKLTILIAKPPKLTARLKILLMGIEQRNSSIVALYSHLELRPDGSDLNAINAHLVDKLYAQIETIRDDSFQLSSFANAEIQQVFTRQFSGMLIVLLILAVVLIGMSIYIYQGIRNSLYQLNKGVSAVSKGLLNQPVKGLKNDEIAEIAHRFNAMVGVLDQTTVSRDQLKMVVEEETRQLKLLSETDALTKLANRRAFDNRYLAELSNSKRNGLPLCLLMVDIDHFKLYNDGYGHKKGDIALSRVAQAIAEILPRETDFAARYGGEEFVVLLPATDIEGARIMAERMCNSIRLINIPHLYSPDAKVLTVSIGVAVTGENTTTESELIQHADDALYQAKHNGRNQYQAYRHDQGDLP